jgi:hypothetical protein
MNLQGRRRKTPEQYASPLYAIDQLKDVLSRYCRLFIHLWVEADGVRFLYGFFVRPLCLITPHTYAGGTHLTR